MARRRPGRCTRASTSAASCSEARAAASRPAAAVVLARVRIAKRSHLVLLRGSAIATVHSQRWAIRAPSRAAVGGEGRADGGVSLGRNGLPDDRAAVWDQPRAAGPKCRRRFAAGNLGPGGDGLGCVLRGGRWRGRAAFRSQARAMQRDQPPFFFCCECHKAAVGLAESWEQHALLSRSNYGRQGRAATGKQNCIALPGRSQAVRPAHAQGPEDLSPGAVGAAQLGALGDPRSPGTASKAPREAAEAGSPGCWVRADLQRALARASSAAMATEDDFYMGEDGIAGMGGEAGEDAAMDDGGAHYDDQGDEGFDHWCVLACSLQARARLDPPSKVHACERADGARGTAEQRSPAARARIGGLPRPAS